MRLWDSMGPIRDRSVNMRPCKIRGYREYLALSNEFMTLDVKGKQIKMYFISIYIQKRKFNLAMLKNR